MNVLYVDLKGKIQTGELIVNRYLAQDMMEIFSRLFEEKHPIEEISLVEKYQADDELSMSHNNTSAFCHRPIEGSAEVSYHSYGLAIDINPLINPYVREKLVLPANASSYRERDKSQFDKEIAQMMIAPGDLIYQLFMDRGYEWGGDWTTPKDYQHFEKHIN